MSLKVGNYILYISDKLLNSVQEALEVDSVVREVSRVEAGLDFSFGVDEQLLGISNSSLVILVLQILNNLLRFRQQVFESLKYATIRSSFVILEAVRDFWFCVGD